MISEHKQIEKCRRCDQLLHGSFCSNCGHPKKLKRINGRYILSEIGSVLNFEKGIFYSIRELILRPGQSVHNFINEDRKRLIRPIVFLIICSLVYTLCLQFLKFEDGYISFSFETNSYITTIFEWLSINYGYTNILMSFSIAFWVRVFFRKHDYNFFEILILLCFVIGVGMLIFSFFGIISTLTDLSILDKGFLIGVLYISWGIGDFFKNRKILNFFKGFACYMLGMLTFAIAMILVGLMFDLINK